MARGRGVGTVAGAAAGAGAGRLLFGNSTTGMLISGAGKPRRQHDGWTAKPRSGGGSEPSRTGGPSSRCNSTSNGSARLQAEQTRIQIERLFEQWRREQGV